MCGYGKPKDNGQGLEITVLSLLIQLGCIIKPEKCQMPSHNHTHWHTLACTHNRLWTQVPSSLNWIECRLQSDRAAESGVNLSQKFTTEWWACVLASWRRHLKLKLIIQTVLTMKMKFPLKCNMLQQLSDCKSFPQTPSTVRRGLLLILLLLLLLRLRLLDAMRIRQMFIWPQYKHWQFESPAWSMNPDCSPGCLLSQANDIETAFGMGFNSDCWLCWWSGL